MARQRRGGVRRDPASGRGDGSAAAASGGGGGPGPVTVVVVVGAAVAAAAALWQCVGTAAPAPKAKSLEGDRKQWAKPTAWRPTRGAKSEEGRVVGGLRLIESIQHDPGAFTQGLTVIPGRPWLYESTGMYGASDVRVLNPRDGQVEIIARLPNTLFGEGIVAVNDMLVLITWREQTGKVFDADELRDVQTFRYDKMTTTNEGWGITHDGSVFIVSDGSDYLHFWTTEDVFASTLTKAPRKKIRYADGTPCTYINELEWIPDGGGTVVLANIWYHDVIVAIDYKMGVVLKVYDFKSLRPKRGKREDCFNGIALNATARTLHVTGKYWPRMYVVDFPDQTEVLNAAREGLAAQQGEDDE